MPYCSKCGTELQPNAAFCSKCGTPAGAAAVPPPYQYGYEKHEKREKETRQTEKYEKREMRGDRSGPIIGGAILILLGVIYFSTVTTPRLIRPGEELAYFLFGIGLILIAQGLYRQLSTKRKTGSGSLYGGIALLAIGGAGIIGQGNIWPFVLIAVGVIIILVAITSRSKAPKP